MRRPIRIANCSGFYGDRLSAAREMVLDGPIDVLTGDYLAELTMSILWKARERDPSAGYATTFLQQAEDVLRPCAEQGIKIVTNAGGLNPADLASALRELCQRLGVHLHVAHIEGDDICDSIDRLQRAGHDFRHMDTGQSMADAGFQPVTANVYLGSWAIVEALNRGADVVVCPRVTDAALTVGPAAWHHGWSRTDWNELAGAVVAGHVIECGTQATGGNFSFFEEIAQLRSPGFPIAEVEADGSSVITKHPGTDGVVTKETVTAQLLYEVGPPRYLTPDVTARLDTVTLESTGDDRVRISNVSGEPPPPDAKVAVNYLGGYHNSMTMGLCGLDIEKKASLAVDALLHRLGGRDEYEEFEAQLSGCRCNERTHAGECYTYLTVHVRDHDREKVGRRFATAVTELGLANYPGLFFTTPPSRERAFAVYWPTLVDASVVEQVVVDASGDRLPVPLAEPAAQSTKLEDAEASEPEDGLHLRSAGDDGVVVPLGRAFGARSGDKGGNANLGVWARQRLGYDWMVRNLTVEGLRELVPETKHYETVRHELPNLWALNFVIVGFLGKGVSSNNRIDPQAKSLAELLRAREVSLPRSVLGTPAFEERA